MFEVDWVVIVLVEVVSVEVDDVSDEVSNESNKRACEASLGINEISNPYLRIKKDVDDVSIVRIITIRNGSRSIIILLIR